MEGAKGFRGRGRTTSGRRYRLVLEERPLTRRIVARRRSQPGSRNTRSAKSPTTNR